MNDFFDLLQPARDKKRIIKTIASIPSNYIGSKRRLLSHIWDVVYDYDIDCDTVFDTFSGGGMVSLLFKHMGKNIITNDILTASSLTAVSLLQNSKIPITDSEINFLCTNVPEDYPTFTTDNYQDKFFTKKECDLLDRYRKNVEILYGQSFYKGDNIHDRHNNPKDDNGYKSAFALFLILSHVSQHCFLGGRYYNGQIIAQLQHRLQHQKNQGKDITKFDIESERFKNVLLDGDARVFNEDIINLLHHKTVTADLIYIDPPYGGGSSDYTKLYGFLEEYLYGASVDDLKHLKQGSKRYCQNKNYQLQLESLLSLCGDFPSWMLSYNESSFADLDTITSIIKNAGRKDIQVSQVPITYQYRKGKNRVDTDHFQESYCNEGHKYLQRGTEYLIVAR